MKSAILSIGTELLFGQVVNTNTVYLSQQLNAMGIDVMYHHTVGDNPERLKQLIIESFEDCDLIITSGGLGPTQDDLTKEMVAEAMGDVIVENEEAMSCVMSYFERTGRKMAANNRKQGMMPSRARVFYNDAGTAPGFALTIDGKTCICMPGPPREMKRMFELKARPYLEDMSDGRIFYKVIRTFGIGESDLETALLPLIEGQTDPTIATYAKEGESTFRVASKRPTLEEAQAAVDEMIQKADAIVGKYVYSYDDKELVEVVVNELKEREMTLSCAESCSGGMFAAAITEVPGASAVLDRGFVTYSNQAKIDMLGVREETLAAHGAVSEETAIEMAMGVKDRTGSDVCISVTGIAGPGGGTDAKPVGTVHICCICGDKRLHRGMRLRSYAGRHWIRNQAVLVMLDMIHGLLNEKYEPDYWFDK